MAKNGNRTLSDWMIGAHPVNSYKTRVADPALKRKNRSSKDICRIIAQAVTGNYNNKTRAKFYDRV
jgi:hypothetical protein